ncbi:TonB-dependent receptor domain-containing protein [Ferrimonas balearica]|uniref:TonB-dependent receptor domain-containing protein n=1 Tax=Ferrimonas balearica TaxID=44012 RepID=UPI001C98FC87|nr:TonB-dependent receptor [Ferrimonas balearica]MBY5920165.1 TonB-dependent receptor [Ferrimonas balearica]MBY5997150.1 TonB-dependent receptor [Ferrimonas balearica]
MKSQPHFQTSPTGLAVAKALSLVSVLSFPAIAADADTETESQQVEVISVVGRLQRAASEVVEERRETPYVSDLMGADQIARTGDSDAAAALRRVTGLTLRNGQFIYVRGLGERYSSTSLNGAQVPSPDPTRSVIPMDLFPAAIIQSLSVQKAASPSSPATFGGGHVDIRTKAIPNDFFFKVSVGGQYNTNNSDDRLTYPGGDDDWLGRDDGTRALPQTITDAFANYGGVSVTDIFRVVQNAEEAVAINQGLALEMNRNMTFQEKSANPGFRGSLSFGHNLDLDDSGDWRFGFVGGTYYKNQTDNYTQREAELANAQGDLSSSSEVRGSEQIVQWSGMWNMGLEWTDDHTISTRTTYLNDTSDDVRITLEETLDTINEDRALEVYSVEYEERTLISNQISGQHFFPYLGDIEANWQYTDARARRQAPNELDYSYSVLEDGSGNVTERTMAKRSDAAVYRYSDLKDDTENYGVDLMLPLFIGDAELKVKGGYEYFERARTSYSTRLAFDASRYQRDNLAGDFSQVFSDANITNPDNGFALLDTTSETDDYVAAQMIDAGFAEFDLNWADAFRLNGGVRYEDFRQVMLPLTPEGEISDEGGRNDILDYTTAEDGWYPSLSGTWIMNDEMQLRLAYSKTLVRPDLREVAPVRFKDPITGFDMIGNAALTSSDIQNFDVRWEWYLESGSNLSVGAFYKDLEAPIESVQVVTEQDTLLTFQNAESGEIYGLETEFHQELGFIDESSAIWDGFFIAGNLTLSDSEINIAPSGNINPTHTRRRMTGHSKWVANLQLSFDSPDNLHAATLVYNVFGDRIAYAGSAGLNDVLEQPFHSLDFTYTLYPLDQMAVKFKAKNILGEETRYQQEGQEVFWKEPGTEFTLTFGFTF